MSPEKNRFKITRRHRQALTVSTAAAALVVGLGAFGMLPPVQHLQKVVGVHDAAVIPQADAVARELALVKLRPSAEQYAELLDVVQLYRATLVDESLGAVVLELTGSEAFVLSCLRALERFEIVEIARSGAVAMESGTAELRFGAQPQLEAGAR